jgi:dual specificity phosphatase 12
MPLDNEDFPGFILRNGKASYNRAIHREDRINAIISLTDTRWAWCNHESAGIPENRQRWAQSADSSTQDLPVYMS